MRKSLVLVLMLTLFGINEGCDLLKQKKLPYQDTRLSFEERARDILKRLTLEEKTSLLSYDSPEIKRLGIPKYNWWNECLHGVARAGEATVFPQAIGLAATFDEGLMHEVSTIISDEARAKHHFFVEQGLREIYTGLTFWSPNINIFRDPRWGRGQETYGEDPLLTGRMAVNFIKGLQGDDPKYLKTVATAKHFAVHSGPEVSRHSDNFDISDKDLYETYLPAFEAAVEEANVQSVMCAYNAFRNKPCCGNNLLIQEILRDRWNFNGYIVSDCGAISDFYIKDAHHYVETGIEAAAEGVKTGTDLNCGFTYKNLDSALVMGLITPDKIDISVKRLLMAMFRLGMFDPESMVPYNSLTIDVVSSPEHIEKSRLAARESMVLLKNEGNILPLDKSLQSVAVIGPNACSEASLYGNYNGFSKNLIDPVQGIRQKLGIGARVFFSPGCPFVEGMHVYEKLPEGILFTEKDVKTQGLLGSYYKGTNYEGTPVLQRVDKKIDFQWIDKLPIGGKLNDRFSVRWEGVLIPEHTAVYDFKFEKGKIWIDGRTFDRPVELSGGEKYTIKLEKSSYNEEEWWGSTITPSAVLTWSDFSKDYKNEALEMARQADLVVFCGGLSPDIEGEEMKGFNLEGFAYGDRSLIKLPDVQEKLLEEIYQLGKKVIYVNISGSAVAFNWADKHIPAIIQAFYPGEQGGNALADVLFGDYNPGGRLPVTFYKSVKDLGDFKDYNMEGKTYRYFRGEPLYPFGYGLSYTDFTYSCLFVEKIGEEGAAHISLDVSNSGPYSGDEVVQVYVKCLEPGIDNANKRLKGFKRIHLDKGETKQVNIDLQPKDLRFWNVSSGSLEFKHGRYVIMIGSSSEDIRLREQTTL
jgi:beta-glucosidase